MKRRGGIISRALLTSTVRGGLRYSQKIDKYGIDVQVALDEAARRHVAVARRHSGGGTVYHDEGTLGEFSIDRCRLLRFPCEGNWHG